MLGKTRFVLLFLGIALLMLSSCSSLSEKRMIPDFEATNYKASHKVLKVNVMEGVFHDVDAGFQKKDLDSKTLRKALMISMDRSGIFKDVVLSELHDYELIVKKEKQKWRGEPDGTVRVILSINYRLTDSNTNKLLWQKDIHTLGKCTLKEFYNGYTRCNTALERALKKNFEKSIQQISFQMP